MQLITTYAVNDHPRPKFLAMHLYMHTINICLALVRFRRRLKTCVDWSKDFPERVVFSLEMGFIQMERGFRDSKTISKQEWD